MVQGTMESTVRQRKKENPEESGDEKETGVGDNVCLYQRKSLWSFLLALDVHLTKRLALCTDKGDRLGSLRPVMKFLEFSCHGIPWIFGNVIAILYFKDKGTLELLVNLFFGKLEVPESESIVTCQLEQLHNTLEILTLFKEELLIG